MLESFEPGSTAKKTKRKKSLPYSLAECQVSLGSFSDNPLQLYHYYSLSVFLAVDLG
jgi:hypothetical protein